MISIIIIVKDDIGILNTLESLKNVAVPEKAETIVVDASEGRLDFIKEKFKDISWYQYQNVKAKKNTIPEQRNFGIKKAKGRVIVFIDANCIAEKNWIKELFSNYLNDGEKIVAGYVKPQSSKSVNNISLNTNSKYVNECPTANVLIAREVFNKVGLFDENFPCGEDVDLMWRAVDAGFKIRYNKNAVVTHDWGSFKDEIKRSFKYGKAKVNLYLKHKNRIKDLFSLEATVTIYSLYIVFLPMAFIFPYYLLLILYPLIKNINRNPFKSTFINFVHSGGFLYQMIKIII